MKVAQICLSAEFHFYGEVEESIRERFFGAVQENDNVFYHGVFTEKDDALYRELGQYDVMLLPTSHVGEGIPGALIEAKVAGLPAIVSNHLYNAEIVEDGVSGIVLEENTPEALMEVVRTLNGDRELLDKMKANAKRSAETYYIDNYIEDVLAQLRE